MTALWIVLGCTAGLAAMIGAGTLTYRYSMLMGWPHEEAWPMAICAFAVFPIALPIALLAWATVWPQRKERARLHRRARLAAMEAECGLGASLAAEDLDEGVR